MSTLNNFIIRVVSEYELGLNNDIVNNFDFRRYSFGRYIEPDSENAKLAYLNYFSFFIANVNRFYSAYQHISDDSKELFIRLILFRSLGYRKIRIKETLDWASELKYFDDIDQYKHSKSTISLSSLFGELYHFEKIPSPLCELKLDCLSGNIVSILHRKQYFYDSNNIKIMPQNGDIVIDAGACFGDTAVYFASHVGNKGHVYSFDPLLEHISVVEFNVKQNKLEDIVTILPYGLGAYSNDVVRSHVESNDELGIAAKQGFSLIGNAGDIPIRSIDDLFLGELNVDKIDFIKMDIEGYELNALKGAYEIIKRDRPKLAISLYHKYEDFYEIPLWIKNNFPEYSLYLEHHTIHTEETVLYCKVL